MGASRSAAAGDIIQIRTCRAVTPGQEAEGERGEAEGERGERTVRSSVASSSAPITCTARVGLQPGCMRLQPRSHRVAAWAHGLQAFTCTARETHVTPSSEVCTS